MNSKIVIEIEGNISRVINKCINNNIYLSDINYLNNDTISCKINVKDYKKIKRLNYYSKIKFKDYDGLDKIKYEIKNNIIYIIIGILSFLLMDIITSYIVDIEVIHSSSTIRKLIYQELENNNIKKYRLAYSYVEIEKIQSKILDNNKERLEWISISKDGMKYIVHAEERKINNITKEEGYRHIVASKDAYITKIISTKGENLVRSGDYVKKGDKLISGEIKLYENVKGNTLATGSVYGNVWYNVFISIPKKEEYQEYTGKERYNLNINNKILLRNKYQYFTQDNIRELNILGFKMKIYKEKEYLIKTREVDTNSDDLARKKIKEKFKKIGRIISQKVLKKEVNNSTIEYRVFVICNELISKYEYYEVGDTIDTQSSN